MKELEKAMTKHYKYQILDHPERENKKELLKLEEWAEKWVLKKSGKLTISAENEIKQILGKLRESALE